MKHPTVPSPDPEGPADRLRRAAAGMGVGLDAATAGALVALLDRLLAQPQNLTAIEDVEEGVDRHLADSLAGLAVPELAGPLCDIGSGGGMPGLVLAMARPDMEVTLVESESRKADWLRLASAGLPNVRVVSDRSETVARHRREAFATVTARAVAPVVPALELAAPLVAPGGHVILWTGDLDPGQTLAANRAAHELGLIPVRDTPVAPFPGARRRLLTLRRDRPTPARYPRRPGRATKRPIA